jgi:tetratricopeptide (TPR) repeat protein/pimeloyl-ACP methyl ester carboxylesterase
MSRLIKIADWSGEKRGTVVFVHGSGGHPYDTWRRTPVDDTFWPRWLAGDLKGLSVYSLGYISPATNWIGTAMPLLDEAANTLRLLLNEAELREGPIAFVCHSLGGLIVKQVLRAANEQRDNPATAGLLARVSQVIFLATPHTGSGKATLIEKLGFWTWGSDSARDLVANKPELRDLNFGYRLLARTRGDELSHLSFYEMVDTVFGRIVQPDSADPGLPNCTPIPIRENHGTIAKPRRRDELIYVETRNLVSKLAPESAGAGELRLYPLEPFKMDWSWSQFIPKLMRIAAIGIIATAIWLGVPRLHALYSAIFSTQVHVVQTRLKVEETRSDVADILRLVSQKEGVPLETLRAILGEMGEVATTADAGEIGRLLTAKAAEFKALVDRLNRLSNADPEVARLRLAAVDALKQGRFVEADADLATAEARDLAGLGDLEALARQKRLSAAQTRAARGDAAMLRTNPDAYRQAASHYAEAARIATISDSDAARGYAIKQGQSLFALGAEFGQNPALVEAIDHFRNLLTTSDRTGDLLNWTRAQNNLGIALEKLGERESGTVKLQEAVTIYRETLKEQTRERAPLDWAMTQSNLGLALARLGERESGTVKLEEAVAAFHEALKERTRERVPFDWALVQNNLGLALWRLGERESGTVKLEEAAAAFREALKERTRERAPLDWAMTQNNLGLALARLGERERGTVKLEEAIAAFREAIKERPRERMPLDWALVQNNLGAALEKLGERESGTVKLEESVAAYHEALKEQTRERVPLDWAMTQNNLGIALWKLGERESGTWKLEDAVAAYREALKELTRERVPLHWAATQNNLGIALWKLGERGSGTVKLEEAVAAYREALKERTRERVPLEWALTQNNLGIALGALGEREGGTVKLEESVAAYREALKERTRERVPLDWALTQNNLGIALRKLGDREGGTVKLEEAVAAYRAALEVLTPEVAPYFHGVLQQNITGCLALLEQRRRT